MTGSWLKGRTLIPHKKTITCKGCKLTFAGRTSYSRHRRQMSDYFRCLPEEVLFNEGFKKRDDGVLFLPKNCILMHHTINKALCAPVPRKRH